MEANASSDTELDADCWAFRGPDGDGFVWLDWDCAGSMESLNLGPAALVSERMAELLVRMDFGE